MKAIALKHFHQAPLKLNCAQAIIYAYQQVYGATSLYLELMKQFGGGRAPGGTCGALHAARLLAPQKAEQITTLFTERNGSTFCKELKRSRTACETCVGHAADILGIVLGPVQERESQA